MIDLHGAQITCNPWLQWQMSPVESASPESDRFSTPQSSAAQLALMGARQSPRHQMPIESKFLENMANALNAEIVPWNVRCFGKKQVHRIS